MRPPSFVVWLGVPIKFEGNGVTGLPHDVLCTPADINTPHKRVHIEAYGGPSLWSNLPAAKLRRGLCWSIPWSSNPPFASWSRNIQAGTSTAEQWGQLSQGKRPRVQSLCLGGRGAANGVTLDYSLV